MQVQKTVLGVTYQKGFHRAHIEVAGDTEEDAIFEASLLIEHLVEVLPGCTIMPPVPQDQTRDGRHVCMVTLIIGTCPEEAKAEIAKIVLRGSL